MNLATKEDNSTQEARTIHCGNLMSEKITEEILYELFLQVSCNIFFFYPIRIVLLHILSVVVVAEFSSYFPHSFTGWSNRKGFNTERKRWQQSIIWIHHLQAFGVGFICIVCIFWNAAT